MKRLEPLHSIEEKNKAVYGCQYVGVNTSEKILKKKDLRKKT